MKKIALFALILLLTAGVVYAKDYEVKKKAGEYDVTVRIDKNPPVTGINNTTVIIKGATGGNITDAKVQIDYSMPAMPGMPAMNYKKEAVLSGAEYKAPIDLSMSGSWNIAVKISRGGKTSSMKFSVDAR